MFERKSYQKMYVIEFFVIKVVFIIKDDFYIVKI